MITAPRVLGTLRVLARRFGSESKDQQPGSVDHDVTETVAVALAKLAIELEHEYCVEPCSGAVVALAFDDERRETGEPWEVVKGSAE